MVQQTCRSTTAGAAGNLLVHWMYTSSIKGKKTVLFLNSHGFPRCAYMPVCIYLCPSVRVCTWEHVYFYTHFFFSLLYGKSGPGLTKRAGIRKSRSWTLCDRDFKVVCELLGSFILLLLSFFVIILQERAAGVGCFSHVWSLLSRAMLFSAMQRGW